MNKVAIVLLGLIAIELAWMIYEIHNFEFVYNG